MPDTFLQRVVSSHMALHHGFEAMIESKFTIEMVRDLSTFEPQGFLNRLNEHLEHIILARGKMCDHRPSKIVARIVNDDSQRADGSVCMYCSSAIEISEIRWKLRSM